MSRTAAAPEEPEDRLPGSADVLDRLPPEPWRSAWDSSPALIAVTSGPEHVLVYQNRASQGVFGARPLGVPMVEAFPESPAASAESLDHVLRTSTIFETQARPIGSRDLHGDEVVLSYVLTPLGNPATGVVMTAVDVTAAVRAQEQVARTRLVADITNAVTGATDAASGLKALTDALVPDVADLAAVYIIPDEHRGDGPPLPPEVLTLSATLALLGPPPPPPVRRGPSPWEPILRAGTSVIIPVEGAMAQVAPEPENAAWFLAAEAHNIAVVPLVVAGTLTGVMVLLAAGARRPYRDGDLPFLEDVAARSGSAITQLRTLRRQHDVAADLQRALLPAAPPALPGMSAAARYVAGAPDVEVGGDWWDLYDLGAGRVALGIGDVSGRGVPAAAVMGQARAVMRAAGHAQLEPVDVLSLLDAQLADLLGVPDGSPGGSAATVGHAPVRFATASYAVVDLDRMRVRLANAGHLPLLVRSADGSVRRVEAPPGAPLGLGIGGFVEVTEPLAPDDTLLMFTDGLVESRVLDIDDGLAMLAAAFVSCGGHDDLDVVADALLAAMERRQGYGPDDVALVVVRIDA